MIETPKAYRMTRTPQHFTKEERKMRKLFITLIVALLIMPTLAIAQERTSGVLRGASDAELSPSIDTFQAKSLQPQAATVTYNWRAVFNYQATDSNWWTGLVIRNRSNPNSMVIHLLDNSGVTSGEGTFSISSNNEQLIGLLNAFINTGHTPTTGSVWIYGTNDFMATMFVGNDSGGFSMLEKEPVEGTWVW